MIYHTNHDILSRQLLGWIADSAVLAGAGRIQLIGEPLALGVLRNTAGKAFDPMGKLRHRKPLLKQIDDVHQLFGVQLKIAVGWVVIEGGT